MPTTPDHPRVPRWLEHCQRCSDIAAPRLPRNLTGHHRGCGGDIVEHQLDDDRRRALARWRPSTIDNEVAYQLRSRFGTGVAR